MHKVEVENYKDAKDNRFAIIQRNASFVIKPTALLAIGEYVVRFAVSWEAANDLAKNHLEPSPVRPQEKARIYQGKPLPW